jgi:N-acetylmuramoyl-L-alanine amidase
MKVVFYFSNYDLFVTYGQSTNFKVTLDAGHGGHDFGAVYNMLKKHSFSGRA